MHSSKRWVFFWFGLGLFLLSVLREWFGLGFYSSWFSFGLGADDISNNYGLQNSIVNGKFKAKSMTGKRKPSLTGALDLAFFFFSSQWCVFPIYDFP